MELTIIGNPNISVVPPKLKFKKGGRKIILWTETGDLYGEGVIFRYSGSIKIIKAKAVSWSSSEVSMGKSIAIGLDHWEMLKGNWETMDSVHWDMLKVTY